MHYELAKELKEAGFPTKMECVKTIKADTLNPECIEERAILPTLSELIEAIGNDLKCLENQRPGWLAASYDGYEEGKTPLIAVARLWLALNKK